MTKVQRGAGAVERAGRESIGRAGASGPPEDEFGELPAALRKGRRQADALGHKLSNWKHRPYAPATAANARCMNCNQMAAVNLEISSEPMGAAVTRRCTKAGRPNPAPKGGQAK